MPHTGGRYPAASAIHTLQYLTCNYKSRHRTLLRYVDAYPLLPWWQPVFIVKEYETITSITARAAIKSSNMYPYNMIKQALDSVGTIRLIHLYVKPIYLERFREIFSCSLLP